MVIDPAKAPITSAPRSPHDGLPCLMSYSSLPIPNAVATDTPIQNDCFSDK